jgi:hypothetical protein
MKLRVGALPVDGHNFPNLALAKVATYYKNMGDTVIRVDPLKVKEAHVDVMFASKVFTFTPECRLPYNESLVVKGGTGYRDYEAVLPDHIDCCTPDLTLFPEYDFAYGFLSRGCIRKCSFCVVPKKEGDLRKYSTLTEVRQGRKKVVLMDNNFLANDAAFVEEQLDAAIQEKVYVDFNQGLDCRLVDDVNAFWLAKVRWKPAVRFACDHASVLPSLRFAVSMLRIAGYKGEVYVYVLAKDLWEAFDRVQRILAIDKKMVPFVQPWRDLEGDGEVKDPSLKHLARWCNRVWIRKKCTFQEYLKGVKK